MSWNSRKGDSEGSMKERRRGRKRERKKEQIEGS